MSVWQWTVESLGAAYRSKRCTPEEITSKVLACADEAAKARPGHRVFVERDDARVQADAKASSDRFANGTPLGLWDGIPIGVKDEVDAEGLSTRSGTTYYPAIPAKRDAFCVRRLREAGAVVTGKLHQHELGYGATGVGPQHPVPRNPHDPDRIPGGSSAGSAVAVSLGLTPMSIGTDAGGSVRIPASLCGVYGLKPTFGRVSRSGDENLSGSLGHVGFLASSIDAIDKALVLTSGCDDADATTKWAPSPYEGRRVIDSLRGLRVGIDESLWRDAEPAIAGRCHDAVDAFKKHGAEVVDVEVEHIHLSRAVGYVMFGAEGAATHAKDVARWGFQMGLDIRAVFAMGAHLRAADYLHALRVRQMIRRSFAECLGNVDLLVMPTTLRTASLVDPAAERSGEIDDATTGALTANTFPANATGLPAITVPVGNDPGGLPVGLQLMGAAWDEALVLGVAAWMERAEVSSVLRPKIAFDVLSR